MDHPLTTLELALILHLFVGSVVSFLGSEDPLSSNVLPDHESDSQCDRMEKEVRLADSKTEAEFPPTLTGRWVSEGCEVRSGPEFLLRSYEFHKNHTFRLLQFYYMDESCSSPAYTIVAWGGYKLGTQSWITVGATEGHYVLNKVSVVAHNDDAAEDLAQKVNSTCPGLVKQIWRPHRAYSILKFGASSPRKASAKNLVLKSLRSRRKKHRSGHHNHRRRNTAARSKARKQTRTRRLDLDCLSALNIVFHELQLIRTQSWPAKLSQNVKPRKELLLGDIHSSPEKRFAYKPTAFQMPIIHTDHINGCHICHLVSRATEISPPILLAKARLPVYINGEWMSQRCESRPMGMFLTRRLRFYYGDKSWQGMFRFFNDPKCLSPLYTVTAAGRFTPGHQSQKVRGGTEFDFRIAQAAIVILDRMMVYNYNGLPRGLCGNGTWIFGIPQDLNSTGGCSNLIKIPSIEYELLRMGFDVKGDPLLFFGQPDTDNKHRGLDARPTAYQAPLIQCRDLPIYPGTVTNLLYPVSYARIGLPAGTAIKVPQCISLILPFLLFLFS